MGTIGLVPRAHVEPRFSTDCAYAPRFHAPLPRQNLTDLLTPTSTIADGLRRHDRPSTHG
jgi:hypothetical protein